MATQDDLFARDDIKRIVEKAKQTTKPVLGTSIKLIKDTAQQIEGKEGPNVRPTSSYKNIEKLSQVERDMGYEKRFQVKGIDSPGRVAEIRLLISKKAPNVENFMTQRGVDWEAYDRALKRFRLTVLEPLIKQNPKAMDILTSPAYLDQFAAETRQNMINNPKLRTIYGIEKVFDKKSREMKWKVPQWAINIENQKLGYIFQSANPRGGLPPGGKVQSKFYQMAQGFWKKFSANMPKEMKALKNVNFKLAINEVDKMLTTAKTALQKKQAIMALTALLTSISKGTFGASLMGLSKASGAYNVLLGAGAISDVLTPTDFLGSKEKDEYAYFPVEEKVEPAPIERFNRGGIMDINHMTRPLGYALGTQAGELVGDRERDELIIVYDTRTGTEDVILKSQQMPYHEIMKPESEEDHGPFLSSPDRLPEIEAMLEEKEGLPYDRDKGYTENLNELMTDIGGTLKEKIFGAGRSLRDKINDFMKYGWGDREDYMEIGGRQVDPDDPNFRRFIEDNYMGEGESYIEGIENYRRFMEGEGFRRGGIVSINRMTRTL